MRQYHHPLPFRHRKPTVFLEQKLPAKMRSFKVFNISVEEGTVTVSTYVPYYCYNMSWVGLDYWSYQVNLTRTPFTFSATKNRFIAIGCELAILWDTSGLRCLKVWKRERLVRLLKQRSHKSHERPQKATDSTRLGCGRRNMRIDGSVLLLLLVLDLPMWT
ncbi:hypothetical protein ACSBR2_036017 [Camellia fascicularis]